MNLLIYETTHHETLPAILDLAELSCTNTSVYLKESSYQNLIAQSLPESMWSNVNFVRQGESESNRHFIRSCFHEARNGNFTHFHISTLDNNLLYFAGQILSMGSIKFSLSVQAINEYVAMKSTTFRDITETVAKAYLHKRIHCYRVFFPKMVDLLKEKMPGSLPVYIPPRFFSAKPGGQTKRNFFKIVVPGSFDPIRRDYRQVLAFFGDVRNSGFFDKKIELVMLGNSANEYGNSIIGGLKKAESEKFTLRYYSDYINPSEYEFQLRDADLFWSPIQIQTRGIRNTPEIYGQSTATGLTGDLLLSARPALVPLGFSVPEHYENAMIVYRSPSDLVAWIKHFMQGPDEERQKKIERDFSHFTRENFIHPFETLLEMV